MKISKEFKNFIFNNFYLRFKKNQAQIAGIFSVASTFQLIVPLKFSV